MEIYIWQLDNHSEFWYENQLHMPAHYQISKPGVTVGYPPEWTVRKRMIQITKIIEWDMGHRVPQHRHKCRNPHGHRYKLELTLSGPVSCVKGSSQEGMICDFGDIKTLMLESIHQKLDHCFMASEDDPIFSDLAQGKGQDLNILLVPFVPTAENIVLWCYERLHPILPTNLSIVRLRLFETPSSYAEYVVTQ